MFIPTPMPPGLEVIKGKPLETWLSGTLVSDFARNTYTDSSQVTGKVGLKNDGTWLPVFGLFSEELPSLCKTQVSYCQRSKTQVSYCQRSKTQVSYCQISKTQVSFCQKSKTQVSYCQKSKTQVSTVKEAKHR